jgi:hypothetical protein
VQRHRQGYVIVIVVLCPGGSHVGDVITESSCDSIHGYVEVATGAYIFVLAVIVAIHTIAARAKQARSAKQAHSRRINIWQAYVECEAEA